MIDVWEFVNAMHLTDTVGHGDPAGRADVHLVLAFVANHMAIAATWHWRGSRDGETNWTFHRVLQFFQKPLGLHSLSDNFSFPLPEGRLQAGQANPLLVQSLTGRRLILHGAARVASLS